MKWLTDIATGLVSPITNTITKRNDNKTKVKRDQINRLKSAEDAEAEWERIQAENSNNSWKDEYVTIIITLPVVVVFLSVFLSVITGNPLMAEAAEAGVDAIKKLLPDYNELLYLVCLAAVGIKAFKRK